MLERLHDSAGLEPIMLGVQYRMLEGIANWPSDHFYQRRLRTALHLKKSQGTADDLPWLKQKPICFIHVEGIDQKIGDSFRNTEQTKVAIQLVSDLVHQESIDSKDIAVRQR